MAATLNTDDPMVRLWPIYGHIQIVSTERWDGRTLILGGYAIYYDKDGKETHRTPDTENVRCFYPEPQPEKWWRFW